MKTEQISFRLSWAQAVSIRAAAKKDGRGMSSYILMLHEEREKRIKRGEK